MLLCTGLLCGCFSDSGNTPTPTTTEGQTLGTDPTVETTQAPLTDALSYTFEFLNESTGQWESVARSGDPIFGDDQWEPGYVEHAYFRIKNTSTLGFNWDLRFDGYNDDVELADVIRVFFLVSDSELPEFTGRDVLETYQDKGTLGDFLTDDKAIHRASLDAGKTVYFRMPLQMSESAGNAHAGLTLEDMTLQLTVSELLLRAASTDQAPDGDFLIRVEGNDTQIDDVMPGDIIERKPSVRNSGTYDQYVRVTVTVSDLAAFRLDMGNDWSAEELFAKPNWGSGSDMVLDSVTEKDDCMIFVLYVNRPVAPGEAIVVYEDIVIPVELTKEAMSTASMEDGIGVDVFAEAVFTANTGINDAKAAFAYAGSGAE